MSNSTFKTILILSITLLAFVSNTFSQIACSSANPKIQSPVCAKPKDAKVISTSCTQMQVQWRGSSGQTYEVSATLKDPVAKISKVFSTTSIVCNNDFNCTAIIPVEAGNVVSWSIEAICANEDRTFYSYTLRGKDVSIPYCRELSDNLSKTIHVYPNPSTGNISVEYLGTSTGNVQFMVYNSMGKVMFNKTEIAAKGINNTYQFHLSDLPAGIYLLEARNGNDVSRTKFVLLR